MSRWLAALGLLALTLMFSLMTAFACGFIANERGVVEGTVLEFKRSSSSMPDAAGQLRIVSDRGEHFFSIDNNPRGVIEPGQLVRVTYRSLGDVEPNGIVVGLTVLQDGREDNKLEVSEREISLRSLLLVAVTLFLAVTTVSWFDQIRKPGTKVGIVDEAENT